MAASRSFGVWASAAPASGISATSAMSSFLTSNLLFLISSRHLGRAQSRRPTDDDSHQQKNTGCFRAAGIVSYRRRERRLGLRGVVAGDRLHFEIFFQTVATPLAAVAGLLVAAERRGAVVR